MQTEYCVDCLNNFFESRSDFVFLFDHIDIVVAATMPKKSWGPNCNFDDKGIWW
jgi:hypothetical protein